MHWAADRGHEGMIRLLAKYGAKLDVRDEDGQTPLFYGTSSSSYACSRSFFLVLLSLAAHSSSIPCIKLLLELGADPSIPDNEGALPSSVAQTEEERAVWIGH